ncbi:SemiSWEET family sugar transporter [Brevundimonas diminuta]
MAEDVANLIGSAAALCSISSFAPQGYKILRERDASAVSLKTYSLTVSCFILWTIYGVMVSAWPVAFANACALFMASGVLLMKWRFRDGKPSATPS